MTRDLQQPPTLTKHNLKIPCLECQPQWLKSLWKHCDVTSGQDQTVPLVTCEKQNNSCLSAGGTPALSVQLYWNCTGTVLFPQMKVGRGTAEMKCSFLSTMFPKLNGGGGRTRLRHLLRWMPVLSMGGVLWGGDEKLGDKTKKPQRCSWH